MTTNREKQLKTLGSRKFSTMMMLPTLITMVIMTVYPMISTILYSFTNFRLLKKNTQFVGFQNYANLLSNEYFQSAILVTVKFTVLSVIFEMLLGFLFALYVDSLKSRKPVIINLEKIDSDTARKIFDFLSGATYALNGNVQKVANNIFIFAPANVDIAGGIQEDEPETGFEKDKPTLTSDSPWGGK